ncbi:MAG: FAD-binding oxidoreductase [Terriglobales bacterium]
MSHQFAPAPATLARELEAIAGADRVHPDAAQFAVDGITPALAVSPGSVQEVAAILRIAAQRQLIVVPAGGFTQQGIGRTPERIDILLDMRRMNAIEHYDPGDLTMGVQAGAALEQVQNTVAEHGQLLPLDPARADVATIGGALATAVHGPLKFAFGGVREFCIGVQFVTADGKIGKGGGRVVKNVAGYDLMKLMIGSFGTLGVITSANFKVFPRPRQTRTFLSEFSSLQKALAFRDGILRSPLQPMALEIMSPIAEMHLGAMLDGAYWRVLLRAGGSDAVLNRYRAELGSAVARELQGDQEAQLWWAVSNFSETVVANFPGAMLMDLSVPINSVGAALSAAESSAVRNGCTFAAVGRSIGSLVLAFVPLANSRACNYAAVAAGVRAALPRDASAVISRCPRVAKSKLDVWGSTPTDLETMRIIKRALDPQDILNRGRFLL